MKIEIKGLLKSNDLDEIFDFELDLFEQSDINIDKILLIDYSNILAEIVTFPTIMNRIGVIQALCDKKLKQEKLKFEIWEAKEKARIRDDFNTDEERPKTRGSKFTKDEVDDAFKMTKLYKVWKNKIIELEFQSTSLNSFYWSAKDKSDKLEKLSTSIEKNINLTAEFKKLEGTRFNHISLRKLKTK